MRKTTKTTTTEEGERLTWRCFVDSKIVFINSTLRFI